MPEEVSVETGTVQVQLISSVFSLQYLNQPPGNRGGRVGALVAARAVEGLVFFGIPHVVGAAGEFFLKFFAGDAAEFLVAR